MKTVRFTRQRTAAPPMGHQAMLTSEVFAAYADAGPCDRIAAECDGELPAPQQGSHPVRGFVGISLRRRVLERRMPHAWQVADERGTGVRIGLGGAQRGCHEFERPLDLRAPRFEE